MGNKPSSIEWTEHGIQGRRDSMEDAAATIPVYGGNDKWAFFGIFDGHFGDGCSKYISANLPKMILKEPGLQTNTAEALRVAYLKADKEFLTMAKPKKMLDGSTGVGVFIKENKLYCANTGDSRAVMCQGGKAVALSEDQKPEQPKEQKRIEANGGVILLGRVQGKLAVARSFGDAEFKNPDTLEPKYITAEPEVKEFDLNQDTQFIIIACDGLWDKMTNAQAVDFVLKRVNEKIPIKMICQDLVQHAYNLGSQDNISAIIIRFVNALPAQSPPPPAAAEPKKEEPKKEAPKNEPDEKIHTDESPTPAAKKPRKKKPSDAPAAEENDDDGPESPKKSPPSDAPADGEAQPAAKKPRKKKSATEEVSEK